MGVLSRKEFNYTELGVGSITVIYSINIFKFFCSDLDVMGREDWSSPSVAEPGLRWVYSE